MTPNLMHILYCKLMSWLTLKNIQSLVLIAATIVGGLWALLRLCKERGWESALEIDLQSIFKTLRAGKIFIFLEVQLTNKGKVKLGAKNIRPSETAYSDEIEKIRYSCSLKLKKLKEPAGDAKYWIDWFNNSNLEDVGDEINLLSEYEDPVEGTDFWMEPGEVYKLGAPLMLAPGLYLAKVTFIGSRSDGEFWSRIMVIDVPLTIAKNI